MEALAKLEAERGTPGYASEEGRWNPKQQEIASGNKIFGRTGGEPIVRNADKPMGPGEDVSRGKGKRERIASNEMCTFLILNISSLQLIPVNMIAYRQQYGSVNPAGVIAPSIVATFISTLTAVVYCKVKDRRRRV